MITKPLLIVAGVSLVALAVLGWLLKESYEANGALETKLENAQAVIDQRERDAKANAIAVAQLADKLSRTETKVVTVTERIYAAPVTRACADSPAMRAARDGIRELLKPPAVPPADRREPPAAVPGSGARATEPQR